MEKYGVVRPGVTPETESDPAEKRGHDKQAETARLDNDATKRLSDAAAKKLEDRPR